MEVSIVIAIAKESEKGVQLIIISRCDSAYLHPVDNGLDQSEIIDLMSAPLMTVIFHLL